MQTEHSSLAGGITAIILTYNESLHVTRCVERARSFTDQVIVVDSFSTDDTVQLAATAGAEVHQNPWVNHAVQFNWALQHVPIHNEWVIRIDADEYVEAADSLPKQLADLPACVNGVRLRRKYFFLGQWMKRGGMYPIETLRIFRHGTAYVENRWMDEHIVLKQGQAVTFEMDIVDDNHNSVSWWIAKHNDYATKEMIETLDYQLGFLDRTGEQERPVGRAAFKRWVKERLYFRLPLFVRPSLYFIYRFIFRLGFLDGKKGIAFHVMQGFWYRALVDLKLLEAKRKIEDVTDNREQVRSRLKAHTGLDFDAG